MKFRRIWSKSFFFSVIYLLIFFYSFCLNAANQGDSSIGTKTIDSISETNANTIDSNKKEGGFLEEDLFPPFEFERRKVYCLVIDPGHGGDDYGVVCSKPRLIEKELTLDIAQRLQALILKNTAHRALLTRKGDYSMSLIDRTIFANNLKADLFLSLHFNAHFDFSLKELQIYITSYSDDEIKDLSKERLNWDASQRIYLAESRDLAIRIEEAARNSGIFESTKLLEMPLYLQKGAHMPAILVENTFLTNPEDMEKLTLEEYRQELAVILYHGIISYIQNMEKENGLH